ncbi:MAG: hypothetical protein C0505_16205 [Leptothrix sp. (in: Bacteria)]|nr:hypothetical protein [Leptothrix sp. (in: b-proteobacteria)]
MSISRFTKSAFAAVTLLVSALAAHAGPVLWLSTGGPNQLATVDVATGATTVVGNTNVFLTDIAFDPTGNLWGISFSDFYSVDKTNGNATLVGSLGSFAGTANALVFGADGTLYMAGSSLYKVNTSTGASTLVGAIGFQSAGDLAFVGGDLFMAASSGQLIDVDTTTGAGAAIGPIGVASTFGLASADNITLYGMAGQTVFTIDTTTGAAGAQVTFNPTLGFAAGSAFQTESGASVPEPGSLALVGAALLAAGALRRRGAVSA